MTIDPHWLEPAVLAILGWLVRQYLRSISESLARLDHLVATVEVHSAKIDINEAEVLRLRNQFDRAIGLRGNGT